tara:strand:- start:159 stop:329 length:171 start_codon:yes stop_codon:yes gene_type:complete
MSMPRNHVSKDELKVRIYKLKTSLFEGDEHHRSGDWHDGAHETLNKVLDLLDEYRY